MVLSGLNILIRNSSKKKKKMNEQVHGTSYKTNIEKLKNIKITILETIYKYSNGTVEWVINYLYLWNGV